MKRKEFNIWVGGVCMVLLILSVLFLALFPAHCAYATDIPCGSTYKSKYKGEIIKCVKQPIPVPSPLPTSNPQPPLPPPSPTPPPPPPGVVCSKTVSKVEEAQLAVNAAVAGQTVCMEPGTYNFAVAFYPRTGVKIFCKPGAKLVFDGGSQEAVRFNTNVTAAAVEGCDISGGWDGVKDTGKNNVTRNNYIHNNKYQGVLCAGCSGATIEGNKIENNGGETCIGWPTANAVSPRHCHDVYISNPGGSYCSNMTGAKVLNNFLGSSGGFGVSVNGYSCPSNSIAGTLIEGNTFVDVSAGVGLYYNTKNTVIKNNSFIIQNPPFTDMPVGMKAAIIVWGGASSEPAMTGNTYKLKTGYTEFKRY